MKKNVGMTDKWIRIILGLAVLSLVFILQGGLRWIGLLGFIPLLTGIFTSCPLYSLLNINTKKEK